VNSFFFSLPSWKEKKIGRVLDLLSCGFVHNALRKRIKNFSHVAFSLSFSSLAGFQLRERERESHVGFFSRGLLGACLHEEKKNFFFSFKISSLLNLFCPKEVVADKKLLCYMALLLSSLE
jgi:hypothetical protein